MGLEPDETHQQEKAVHDDSEPGDHEAIGR